MNTKLTLTMEHTIIKKAKDYAGKKGLNLSGIIENYFKVLTKEDVSSDISLTPIVKSLKGSYKAPTHYDYKKQLSKRQYLKTRIASH